MWGSMESAFRLQPKVVGVGHCAGSVSSPEVGMDVIDFWYERELKRPKFYFIRKKVSVNKSLDTCTKLTDIIQSSIQFLIQIGLKFNELDS